jgi:CheY-like chemotaxis protein
MLENDMDDRYFTQSALEELGLDVSIRFIADVAELNHSLITHKPSLVLLSSNTYPRTGIQVLNWFKTDTQLSHIPVVVLSEDLIDDHVREYYRAGANSVVKKPSTMALTKQKIQTFFSYWFGVAEL